MGRKTSRDEIWSAVIDERDGFLDSERGDRHGSSWTAEDIADRDDVDASIRTVRDCLGTMADLGHIVKSGGGGRTHAKYRPPEDMRPPRGKQDCGHCQASSYQLDGETVAVIDGDRRAIDAATWLCPRCLRAYAADDDGEAFAEREGANAGRTSYGQEIV